MNSNEQDARPADVANPYAAPIALDSATAITPGTLRAAPPSLRFWTFMLDQVGIFLFAMLRGIIVGIAAALSGHEDWLADGSNLVVSIASMLAYYIVFEATLGRTPGKMIVGTRVVDLEGNHPSFRQIVIRTFARLVPFEPFSCLSDDGGWHDDWSKTRVIRTRGQAEPEKPS